MIRFGMIIRLLMIAACLVPFTSPRQASAALSPRSADTNLPTPAPREEDDNEREEEVSEKDQSHQSQQRLDRKPALAGRLALPLRISSLRVPAPTLIPPADPFHNGLGSPYLC